MLFAKLFVVSIAMSLAWFALTPAVGLLSLAKAIALGTAVSIAIALFYPEIRGIKRGDSVSVVHNSALPALMGKAGHALSDARKNQELRIRFDNGNEAMGIVEGYEGILSLPKIKLVYEEKLG